MDILWFALIGICAGWLAGQIMKGGGFGLVGDLIVGVIGAILGGFLFSVLKITFIVGTPLLTSLIIATLGAMLLLFILKKVVKA